MKKQTGFTLIELIIVIIILGILAVTAAPKFIDIQSDATRASVEGLRAAVQSGAQLVYAKSAVAGEQGNAAGSTATSTSLVSGVELRTNFGYPHANPLTAIQAGGSLAATDVAVFADINSADWAFIAGSGASAVAANPAAGSFGISPTGATVNYTITAANGASCHLLYTNAVDANNPATVTIVTGGC